MPFSTVVGHDAAIRSLRRALRQERLPTGYLFSGPPHIGKTTLALALAQAANCEQPVADAEGLPDACGQCTTCRRIAEESYADSAVIRPRLREKVKDDEEEEEAREIAADLDDATISREPLARLRMQVAATAVEAQHRVFVVANAEAMNAAAANLFLKTLEEPPPATTFVLTSARPSALLPTIVSRCQTLTLHPLHPEELRLALAERWPQVEAARREQVLALSEGAYGRALVLMERPELLALRGELLDMLAGLPEREPWEALRLGEEMVDLGERWWHVEHPDEGGQDLFKHAHDRAVRAALYEVLAVMQSWFRDLLALDQPGLLTNADHRGKLQVAAASYPAETALAAQRILGGLREDLRQNPNLLLSTQALFVRLLSLRS